MLGRKKPSPGRLHRRSKTLQSTSLVGPSLQKRLQNQHRSHLIDDPFAPDRSMPSVVQMPVRLRRRQPLIPQMHRNPELAAQLLGKRLRLDRLRTLVAGHIQRIPHHRLRHSMLPKHTPHGLQIRPLASPVQRKQWLRRIPQRVRDCQPYPSIPHIEPQNPRHKSAGLRILFRSLLARAVFKRILGHGLECNGRTVK
jgi:hypothetical protein